MFRHICKCLKMNKAPSLQSNRMNVLSFTCRRTYTVWSHRWPSEAISHQPGAWPARPREPSLSTLPALGLQKLHITLPGCFYVSSGVGFRSSCSRGKRLPGSQDFPTEIKREPCVSSKIFLEAALEKETREIGFNDMPNKPQI